ncbi:uncharacterized protein LOC107323812 [Coturnix japonica]|uniref:uncharacterized protein LOC107323812 n=1 Tax=Coturnix japonica TaxID=93934 RepID=UPI0007777863|nr:uncharacterized protein LOC107323812 [Coturnix japonica]
MELISGKVPDSLLNSLPKPEPKKWGKLINGLCSLVKASPGRAKQPEPPTFSGSMSLLDIVERMSSPSKRAESAAGSWCSCFCLGKPSPVAKHQLQSSAREPSEAEVLVLAGDPSPCISPRRRACYDDASSINEELLLSTECCSSDESLPYNISYQEKKVIIVEAFIHPIPTEAADLSPPDTSGTSLDSMSLQCSPAQAQPECPDSSTTMQAIGRINIISSPAIIALQQEELALTNIRQCCLPLSLSSDQKCNYAVHGDQMLSVTILHIPCNHLPGSHILRVSYKENTLDGVMKNWR